METLPSSFLSAARIILRSRSEVASFLVGGLVFMERDLRIQTFLGIGAQHITHLMFLVAHKIAQPVQFLCAFTFQNGPDLDDFVFEDAVAIDAKGFLAHARSVLGADRHKIGYRCLSVAMKA